MKLADRPPMKKTTSEKAPQEGSPDFNARKCERKARIELPIVLEDEKHGTSPEEEREMAEKEEDTSYESKAIRDDIDLDTDEESESGYDVIQEVSELKEDEQEKDSRPSSQNHTLQGNDISPEPKRTKKTETGFPNTTSHPTSTPYASQVMNPLQGVGSFRSSIVVTPASSSLLKQSTQNNPEMTENITKVAKRMDSSVTN